LIPLFPYSSTAAIGYFCGMGTTKMEMNHLEIEWGCKRYHDGEVVGTMVISKRSTVSLFS